MCEMSMNVVVYLAYNLMKCSECAELWDRFFAACVHQFDCEQRLEATILHDEGKSHSALSLGTEGANATVTSIMEEIREHLKAGHASPIE